MGKFIWVGSRRMLWPALPFLDGRSSHQSCEMGQEGPADAGVENETDGGSKLVEMASSAVAILLSGCPRDGAG